MVQELICEDLVKRFGGVPAVDGVSFAVTRGEVLGIAGANGSGKTTLFNVIAGKYRADSGRAVLNGTQITGLPQHRVCHLGVGRTFQAATNADSRTVLENLLLAAAYGRQHVRPPIRFTPEALSLATEAMDFVGLSHKAAQQAGSLSVYEQRRLMIGAGLASNPKVLLLDEPVAGLVSEELDEVAAMLALVRQRGVTLLVVEHVMRFLAAVAPGRILIMHQGKKFMEGTAADVFEDEGVRSVWLGSARAGGQANG